MLMFFGQRGRVKMRFSGVPGENTIRFEGRDGDGGDL
jgi:hypothetical protein